MVLQLEPVKSAFPSLGKGWSQQYVLTHLLITDIKKVHFGHK